MAFFSPRCIELTHMSDLSDKEAYDHLTEKVPGLCHMLVPLMQGYQAWKGISAKSIMLLLLTIAASLANILPKAAALPAEEAFLSTSYAPHK